MKSTSSKLAMKIRRKKNQTRRKKVKNVGSRKNQKRNSKGMKKQKRKSRGGGCGQLHCNTCGKTCKEIMSDLCVCPDGHGGCRNRAI
tara:strand:+ start:1450 stop:1710 length:261 start_codon:yes stop_codon:yes gene_type:complete